MNCLLKPIWFWNVFSWIWDLKQTSDDTGDKEKYRSGIPKTLSECTILPFLRALGKFFSVLSFSLCALWSQSNWLFSIQGRAGWLEGSYAWSGDQNSHILNGKTQPLILFKAPRGNCYLQSTVPNWWSLVGGSIISQSKVPQELLLVHTQPSPGHSNNSCLLLYVKVHVFVLFCVDKG